MKINCTLLTWLKYLSLLILLFSDFLLNGQTASYNYFYRIYFRDKGLNTSITDPSLLLSERALNRREKAGITAPDFRDQPVFRDYLDQIKSAGLVLHCTSKWLNTGLFKTKEPFNTDLLTGLPFVTAVKTVKSPGIKSINSNKLDFAVTESDFPPYDQPLTMINGQLLHNTGFDGKGILIAVTDGGFDNADEIPSLIPLRTRKGIRSTWDFVSGSQNV